MRNINAKMKNGGHISSLLAQGEEGNIIWVNIEVYLPLSKVLRPHLSDVLCFIQFLFVHVHRPDPNLP